MFKNAVLSFLKNKKTLVLTFLLVIAVLALVTLTNFEPHTETTNHTEFSESETLAMCSPIGYNTFVNGSGLVCYQSVGDDPQIYIPVAATGINTVKLNFHTMKDNTGCQVYYLLEGEADLSEGYSAKGALGKGGKYCITYIPEVDFIQLRIDVDGTFAISGLELYKTEAVSLVRSLSISSVIVLAVDLMLFILLLIFEKHLGYLAFIKSAFIKRFEYLKTALREKHIAAFIARILLYVFALLFCASVFILILLSKYSIGLAMVVFAIGVLLAAAYIADAALSGNIKPAVMFLALTLIIGMTIAMVKPPSVGGGWDEAIHYKNTSALKCALFGGPYTLADSRCENYVYYYDRYNYEGATYFLDMILEDDVELEPNKLEISIYKALGYLPSAFALRVSEILNADMIKSLLIAKIAPLFVYAFVIYYGLRKLKSGQLIFSTVAMLPTAVYIATTINYDSWVTAFIGCSYILLVAAMQDSEKKLRLSDIALMLGLFFLGCGPKAIYFFLIFPFFFIPKSKFEKEKYGRYSRIAAFGTLLVIALIMLLPFLFDMQIMTDTRGDVGGSAVNAGDQVEYILKNPFDYFLILTEFLFMYLSPANANNFAAAIHPHGQAPAYIGSLSILVLIVSALLDRGECDGFIGRKRLKTTSFITFLGTAALVATALYISFTPVGYKTVNGCQWRYLIPALFPLVYAAGSSRIIKPFNKKIMYITVFSVIAFSAFGTWFEVLLRGWIEWSNAEGRPIPFL